MKRKHLVIWSARKGPALLHAFLACVAGTLFASTPVLAQVAFEDRSLAAGLDYVGESYGASVGYSNADKLPDFFLSRHRHEPALLINLANGTFEDRFFEVDVWQIVPNSDQHGGSWADFDNDGDHDLTITAGSKNFSQFLVNNGAFLSDEVANYSFDKKDWGGRLPVWFDFSRDGVLDVAFAIQEQRFQLFEQINGDFEKRNFDAGNLCEDNDYGQLADLTSDGLVDWVCVTQSQFPQFIYDYSTGLPFVDQSALASPVSNIVDSVIADFDGDLVPELLGLRGRTRLSGAEIVVPEAPFLGSIEAQLIDQNGSDTVVTFRSTGDVTFELHWNARNASNVYIGAAGTNPPFPPDGEPIRFTLSPSDSSIEGIRSYDPTVDLGVFVGYEPTTQTWTFANSSGTRPNSYLYTYMDSTEAVSDLGVTGLTALDQPRVPALLKYNAGLGIFEDSTAGSGLDTELLCVSVVAADFDNDMDLDLYFACRNAVSNAANMFFLNDGAGVFTPMAGPSGAEGPVGSGVGLAETVVTSDYDVDGFVDLLVTNGLKLYPEPPFTDGGPEKLFRNLGNSNHWIELDLEGTTSNRDGVGAIVTVTAGGKAQRREQNGAYHRWSQNDTRLHFGLAGNTEVDIEVLWPSGQFDSYSGVAADKLYTLVEGAVLPTEETIPTSTPPSVCEQTAGIPVYDPAAEIELFIWKDDCGSNNWKVRATGGASPSVVFDGSIVSSVPILTLNGDGLEPDDILTLENGSTQVSYSLIVGNGGEDGFDITFADDASVCFGVNSSVATALAGALPTQLVLPVNLETLGPCSQTTPVVSVADSSALESTTDGVMVFTLSLDFPSANTVTVNYSTSDGDALEPGDYLAAVGTVEFLPGDTVATVEVTLVDDSETEFSEFFNLTLDTPINVQIGDGVAVGTIEDDEPGACGVPPFDKATENGLFLWQDCVTQEWSVRVTAGGVSSVFVGNIQADNAFTSVVPFSIESSDVLDFTTDTSVIDFALAVGNAGQDGFEFQFDALTSACFDFGGPGTTVYVGASRNPLTPPFDLQTLDACFPDKTNLITVQTLASANPMPVEGETVEFEIAVSNAGPSAATNVALTDTLPAGVTFVSYTATLGSYDSTTGIWTVGALADQANATLTLEVTVDAGELGNTITNVTSAAASDQLDPTTAGDVLQVSISVGADPGSTADLVTVQSLASGDATPLEGETVVFDITVSNNGPGTATNARLTDLLPAGLTYDSHGATQGLYDPVTGNWAIGEMVSSSVATLSLAATVDVGQTGNDITNSATAAVSDLFDPTAAGDSLDVSLSIATLATPLTDWGLASGGVSASGNQIVYDGITEGWNNNTINSPALSSLGFVDDYEVRFILDSDPALTTWVIGLGIEESGSSRDDVDFGLRSSNGGLNVRENGVWRTAGPALGAGDVISIYVNAGLLEYRYNGAVIYSSSYAGTPDFYVDSSFKSGAVAISVEIVGEPVPVDPPTLVAIANWLGETGGVTATADDLSYSGSPTGWTNNTVNSAALSTLGAAGDYKVSWTVGTDPAGTNWVVGFGDIELSADRTDVDFGLQCSNGDLTARRNGVWVASGGNISAGDLLSLRVVGTTIEYQLNGVAFATADTVGTEDFYIDTAFKSGIIGLNDFVLELP